ncbi:MAG: hypothetical protein F6J89_20210, partial [Symploca sp. SIO1C4]|nr:hypothetical protein [Symploca sp. SIO1C4]
VPVTGLPAEEYLPLFPYGGVSGKLSHYQQMEEQLLNPQRRQRIQILAQTDNTPLISTAEEVSSTPVTSLNEPSVSSAPMMAANTSATAPMMAANTAPTVEEEESITGTTAQGLLATYSSDYETLNKLLLAKDTEGISLSFQDLERRSNLRSAFGSNQMFLVITDPNSLKTFDTSEPPQVIKEYFLENLLTIVGWKFNLNPDNWRVNQSDGSNTVLIFKFLDKPLLDILKDTALWEQPDVFVANDANPQTQVQQIKEVRDRLVKFFEDAIATANDPNASEKDRDNAAPLARVGSSTFWSGMIALNVALPADLGLPQELRALECGIQNADNFYAQYVGSNGTPILPKDGQLEAEQSSLFGLLDYQDNSVPETGPSGYAFQVSSLRVQFQNSQISAFSSEVNLTLDKLFGEATLLLNSRSRRNIVILKGFTEEHNGVTTYAFSFSGENYFALPDSYILNTVDIVKAEFATDPDSQEVTIGRFTLWGRFNFRNLAEIDLFSFGIETPPDQELLNFNNFEDNPGKLALTALEVLNRKGLVDNNQQAQDVLTDYNNLIASGEEIRDSITAIQDRALEAFQSLNAEILTIDDEDVQLAVKASNLNETLKLLDDNEQFLPFSKVVIIMECNNAGDTTFSFDSSQIAFDLVKSKVRTNSLYGKFPLKLVNFVELDPNKPDSQPKGYLPVKTPLGSSSIPTSGFGLNFELNLGSLGALAGAAQFVVNLLVVWQPNSDGSQEKAQTFVGLRLPGIGGDVLGFPLQSVLKLSFKTVELIVDRSSNNAAYLLKIKKIALKLFVLSFPPNGQTEIVIFGNPDATDSNDAVGWYAAYAK